MDPLTAGLKAAEIIAQAVVETMKMYQTPEGQLLLAEQRKDKAKFDAQLGNVGDFLQSAFTGKLFSPRAS